jgi:predicted O-methyltransferase YrrM
MKQTIEAEDVLREIESLTERAFLPIIGPKKGRHLVDTVRRFGVKNILEVGTLIGYSAILIAKNLSEDGKVVTIERDLMSARAAEANVAKAALCDKIEIRIGNALQVIPALNQGFDMVFIDATKTEYLDYLRLAEKNLKKGGVVFADNVKIFAREMKDYLDYVRNSGKYSSEYIDEGFDGVEVSIKLS